MNRTKVFVCYSHEDSRYLKELQTHLGYFARKGRIDFWDDTKIAPGSVSHDEIRQAIESAKVAVLLISADFLSSESIAKDELPLLLATADHGDLTILPVIIRPCLFSSSDLKQFPAVNDPSEPLSAMTESRKEEEWTKVALLVEALLNSQNLTAYGKNLNDLGDYDKAAVVLRHACRLKPDSFEAWFENAYALGKLEHYSELVKTLGYARALESHRIVTSKGPSTLRTSRFAGAGSGTYNHGLGAMPDAIILTGTNGSEGIRYDSLTTTQVRVIQNSPQAFVGLAIKYEVT